jgi:AraC-like DNA-binding protein/mannose-6-phosphate isomerase-like protein (cupin superfamily)
MPRRSSKPVKFERELVFRERSFPLDVLILENHPDYPQVVHDFSQVVIVLHGRGINVVGKEEFPVKAGDVFVHHGGRPHGYRDTHNLGVINVIYEPFLLNRVRLDVAGLPGYQALFVVEPALRRRGQFARHLTLGVRELSKARELAEAIEAELHGDAPRMRSVRYEERHETRHDRRVSHRAPGHRFMALAQFMTLVVLLSRAYNTTPTVESERIMKIGRAIAHLESHFGEEVKPSELARIVGMSERNFYRFFCDVTHETPHAYLQKVRLARGATMLRTSDKTVTEVALECGFSDGSYFARQFRMAYGISPRQFQTGRRKAGKPS